MEVFMIDNTEKITINMAAVDLGKVDLLVQEALYSNRSDFIRTAIRNQLDKDSKELQQAITRSSSVIGVLSYSRKDLAAKKAKNERLVISVVGLLRLGRDIEPELARDVIESINVKGILDVGPELKAALEDRIT
jgi:Arc/MetJ-type ribon-helix-helix transcriptional regulator